MKDHLTQTDMLRYVQTVTMTPENLAFVSRVNTHVFGCAECQEALNAFCAQMEQDVYGGKDAMHDDRGTVR